MTAPNLTLNETRISCNGRMPSNVKPNDLVTFEYRNGHSAKEPREASKAVYAKRDYAFDVASLVIVERAREL